MDPIICSGLSILALPKKVGEKGTGGPGAVSEGEPSDGRDTAVVVKTVLDLILVGR